MSRIQSLVLIKLESFPSPMQPGKFYFSERYRSAGHLCCCGCGLEVITPLNPAKWRLTEHGKSFSLFPSIGNWSFPCRSHYVISNGRIRWAEGFSNARIRHVQKRDLATTQVSSEKLEESNHSVSKTPTVHKSWWSRFFS